MAPVLAGGLQRAAERLPGIAESVPCVMMSASGQPDSPHRSSDPVAEFLREAAARVHALREQAEATARGIAASADDPGLEGAARGEVATELGAALVGRAAKLAEECAQLDELIGRVAVAYGEEGETASRPDGPDGGREPSEAAAGSPGAAEREHGERERPGPFAGASLREVEAGPAEALGLGPTEEGGTSEQAPPDDDVTKDRPLTEAVPGPSGGAADVSEGIKLLVMQMAVSGAGRAEIQRRLTADFGVEDSASVVAELFEGN